MLRIAIVGAGGFGREVFDVIDAMTTNGADLEVVGFLDDGHPEAATLTPYGVPHLGPVSLLDDMPPDIQFIVGVGSSSDRRRIVAAFPQRTSPVLVHPAASRGRAVELAPGTVVCAGARLTNNIRVGRHVHLNLNSTIGHDSTIGDFVTISPLAALSGYVTLENQVTLGTGVSVNPGVTIGKGTTVGSGAVVVGDLPPGVVAVGVPARPRQPWTSG